MKREIMFVLGVIVYIFLILTLPLALPFIAMLLILGYLSHLDERGEDNG